MGASRVVAHIGGLDLYDGLRYARPKRERKSSCKILQYRKSIQRCVDALPCSRTASASPSRAANPRIASKREQLARVEVHLVRSEEDPALGSGESAVDRRDVTRRDRAPSAGATPLPL